MSANCGPVDEMPTRIQCRRVKGWRKSPNTIIVTRSSRWGNPYVIRPDLPPGTEIRVGRRICVAVPTRDEAIKRFRDEYMTPERREAARWELRGKDLACYCRLDEPCHADVLLEIANGDWEAGPGGGIGEYQRADRVAMMRREHSLYVGKAFFSCR